MVSSSETRSFFHIMSAIWFLVRLSSITPISLIPVSRKVFSNLSAHSKLINIININISRKVLLVFI